MEPIVTCSTCHRPISRGKTTAYSGQTRCLVCRVAADLRGWRYDPPANVRRRTEAYRARQRECTEDRRRKAARVVTAWRGGDSV